MAWLVKRGERLINLDEIAWIGKEFSHHAYPPPPEAPVESAEPEVSVEAPATDAPEIPTEAAEPPPEAPTAEATVPIQPEQPAIPVPSRTLYRVVAVYKGSGGVDRMPEGALLPLARELPDNANLTNRLLADALAVLKTLVPTTASRLAPEVLFVGEEAECQARVNTILDSIQQQVEYIPIGE